MSVRESIKKAVLDRNINRVRAIILRQINSDRDQLEFETITSCQYAEAELSNTSQSLFDEDDGETEFSESKNTWNKELWQALRIEFEYNFSKLKFERIILVMRHLREQGHPDFVAGESKTRTSTINNTNPVNSGGGEGSVTKKSDKKDDKKLPIRTTQNTHHQDEPRPANAHTNHSYATAGMAGAVVGGIAGTFIKMTIPGAIVGAIIVLGIILAKKNSKD